MKREFQASDGLLIEKVVNKLDFCKISRIMEFLEWEWGSVDGVPNQITLFNFAIEILTLAYKDYLDKDSKEMVYVSSGGFVAMCYPDDKGDPVLQISFVLESSDTYDI
jgi:hypothetical protein